MNRQYSKEEKNNIKINLQYMIKILDQIFKSQNLKKEISEFF